MARIVLHPENLNIVSSPSTGPQLSVHTRAALGLSHNARELTALTRIASLCTPHTRLQDETYFLSPEPHWSATRV